MELAAVAGAAILSALVGGAAGHRLASNAERRRNREALRLLRVLVEVADSSPFAAVGLVVEHCLPDVRKISGANNP